MKKTELLKIFAILIWAFFLSILMTCTSCTKDELKYINKNTYSNRAGYWDYCYFQSDEINTQLKLINTEIVPDDDQTETIEYYEMNCPRNGVLVYTVKITYQE